MPVSTILAVVFVLGLVIVIVMFSGQKKKSGLPMQGSSGVSQDWGESNVYNRKEI